MGVVKIRITQRKNGTVAAWFPKGTSGFTGRVRTRLGSDWMKAGRMKMLGDFAIALQREQCAAGLGSDGAPMPPLKARLKFQQRVNGKAVFVANREKTLRDLYGPGIGGHMLDAIRINYLDHRKVTVAITTTKARIKAQANENRAAWWGLSPASIEKLRKKAEEVLTLGFQEQLAARGLASQSGVIAKQVLGLAA